MLVPLCNCNHHFSFIPTKTLPSPTFQIHSCRYPSTAFKPFRRRATISAASISQALPQSAIHRIAEKLRSLGYVEESNDDASVEPLKLGPNSPGEIFVPLPTRLPKHRVGHTLDSSWSTPENPVPDPGSGNAIQRFNELRRGVLEEEERVRKRDEGKGKSVPSLAELTLPEEELRRLRSIGIGLKKKLKVGKAGITEGIVNGIHERWRRSEVLKITCEDICRLNMKRTHELLEKKTGGLVIWRSGSNILLYRGSNYKYPYFSIEKLASGSSSEETDDTDKDQRIPSKNVESTGPNPNARITYPPIIKSVGLPNRVRFQLPGEAQLAEEADAMLEGLGPRFKDWWGYDPLPVDADLLPAVVAGHKRPFRLLPYGVQPKLTNDELTTLKRLGRPLPCHFALGRNRKHQGLAAAIVKLWEKCEIAKIAVKRGVQNTNSELMAEELKLLTGGTLLSRDKEFFVFYRGKDFLPASVSSAIEERRRKNVSESWTTNSSILNLKDKKRETKEYDAGVEDEEENNQNLPGHSEERRRRFSRTAVEITSNRLSKALEKKAKAEKLLEELEKSETPQPPETDKEGRRGVFDGTVENMHLHWKYRELVKVCIGRRTAEELHEIARTLEAESGGILVAVERVSKGNAIIVYRGKNYTRPASLRPETLLSKRAALKRSIEEQRRQSLKLHILKLNMNIDELQLKMAKDNDTSDSQCTEDSKHGYVEQEVIENHHDDDKTYHKDRDPTNMARESHGTNPIHTSEGSTHIAQQPSQVDISSEPVVKSKYVFDITETDLQPKSLPNEIRGFLNTNEQNVELSSYHRSRYRASSSTTEFEPPVEKANEERLSMMPATALQLSNKERLLLRKQALRMKKIPLLAVGHLKLMSGVPNPISLAILGKTNSITGLAKAIKGHFEKHPLAIVSVKGRAKGTSAQEVIYNLEQATCAVLVSREPSKVILYRGWGFKADPDRASRKIGKEFKCESDGGEVKARRFISPELKSAMRLECGLKSVTNQGLASGSIADGRADDIPEDKPTLA